MHWFGQDEPRYPDRFNAASVLLDSWIDTGQGGRTVLQHSGGPWTYERLYETANRIAHVLVDDCGLVPGGRVLLRSPNHPMLVACWLAVLKAGGIAVSTMPLLRVRELTEIIDKAGISLALSHADVAADLEEALKPRARAQLVQFKSHGERSLESLMASRSPRFTNVSTAADDPAIIAFTSGTTGRSKGTVHFHRDLIAATDAYGRQILQPAGDDIFIGSPPLAFTYALGGLVLFPMRFGASSVMLEQVTPPLLLEGIEKCGRRSSSRRRQATARCCRRSASSTCPASANACQQGNAARVHVQCMARDGGDPPDGRHRLHRDAAHLHRVRRRPCAARLDRPGHSGLSRDRGGSRRERSVHRHRRPSRGVGPYRMPVPRRSGQSAEVRPAGLEPDRRRVSRR
jgi:hypothetical protein